MRNSFYSKFIIIVLIALLLPILSYTIFLITQRNKDEELIKSIYDRQLSSILFSVNQHCWDRFGSWASALGLMIIANQNEESRDVVESIIQTSIQQYAPVSAVYVRLTDNRRFLVWDPSTVQENAVDFRFRDLRRIEFIIHQSGSKIDKMILDGLKGYVRPVAVKWDSTSKDPSTLLFFPIIHESLLKSEALLAGIFVKNHSFINEIVARKFLEIGDENLIFAIKDLGRGIILSPISQEEIPETYPTFEEQFVISVEMGREVSQSFEKSERLWILPDLDLLIKISGTTLEQISKTRSRRNIIYIVLANIILILGVLTLLRNMMKEMRLAQLKTDFVANVSHELRTPLSLIRLYSETLEMGRVHSEEKKKRYYQIIMNESSRLTRLINNILDFSKIESKRKKYYFEPTPLDELVQDTLDMVRFNLDQKGFEVHQDIESGLPDVEIDREAITLAFVNLLDNAIKFSPDRKSITVALKKIDNKLNLSVRDSGIGIPESEQKNIFEKFYRIGSSLVHNTKGSGLGLSLVKHIMDIHHGQVTVTSKPGEGSTFSLVFPIEDK